MKGFCPKGVLSHRGFVPEGFCPRGFCPRGFCPRGVLSYTLNRRYLAIATVKTGSNHCRCGFRSLPRAASSFSALYLHLRATTEDGPAMTVNDTFYSLFYTKYLLYSNYITNSSGRSYSFTAQCVPHSTLSRLCLPQIPVHSMLAAWTPSHLRPSQAFPRLPSNYTTSHDLPVTYGISQIPLK